jgi:ADP-heptose:LPS heptosyltransferase
VVVRRITPAPGDGDYDAFIPAIPPFYWSAFAARYAGRPRTVPRPPDSLFYQDEQQYYLAFARALGYEGRRPFARLPVAAVDRFGVGATTVVLAPGCKTGEMAAKRWPWFPQLADRFDEVAVVGTHDDRKSFEGAEMQFPAHVRSFVGSLTLRETAELLASAGIVVANDSGLGHMAAAVGTPTILLFGPTPHLTLGALAPNVTTVRAGLPCEPCWFSAARFHACDARVDCLRAIGVDLVERTVRDGLVHRDRRPTLAAEARS